MVPLLGSVLRLAFSVDICTHVLSTYWSKSEVVTVRGFVHRVDGNSMHSSQGTHGRDPSCSAYLEHRGVVIVHGKSSEGIVERIPVRHFSLKAASRRALPSSFRALFSAAVAPIVPLGAP